MNTTIMQRYITSTRDMDDIESAITAELGGENHRCAFLRSQSYLRLRIAALYKAEQAPYTAYFSTLKVALDWTNDGKRVTLQRVDCLEFQDEEDPPECCEPQGALSPCKRPRL
jgi:hypothetical protein